MNRSLELDMTQLNENYYLFLKMRSVGSSGVYSYIMISEV